MKHTLKQSQLKSLHGWSVGMTGYVNNVDFPNLHGRQVEVLNPFLPDENAIVSFLDTILDGGVRTVIVSIHEIVRGRAQLERSSDVKTQL